MDIRFWTLLSLWSKSPTALCLCYLKGDKSSVLDIDHPDLSRFPLFAHAVRMEGRLQPGDILFIPGKTLSVFLALCFLSSFFVFCFTLSFLSFFSHFYYFLFSCPPPPPPPHSFFLAFPSLIHCFFSFTHSFFLSLILSFFHSFFFYFFSSFFHSFLS